MPCPFCRAHGGCPTNEKTCVTKSAFAVQATTAKKKAAKKKKAPK